MSIWEGPIKDVLKDPDSAKFKDVIFVLTATGTLFTCGEVNCKNSLGGYTGNKSIITAGLSEYTLIESETEGFSEFWNDICVKGQQLKQNQYITLK